MKPRFAILTVVVLIIIVISGCPVIPKPFTTGSFTLTINSVNPGRTVFPDVSSSIVSYKIDFSGDTPVPAVTTTGTVVNIDLPAGSWDITVYGMDGPDGTGNAVAAGTVSVSISTGSTTDASVSVSPLSAETGNISITIAWPDTQTIDDTSTITFDGTSYAVSDPEVTFNGTARTLDFQLSTVSSSGDHTFFAFLKDTGTLQTTVSESVQVYDNLTSSAVIALNTGDFTQPPPASTLSSLVEGDGQIVLTWGNSSNVVTGFSIERSLSEASGYSVIGTTDGVTLTYTDATVIPGVTYYYRVIASSEGGASDSSNTESLAVEAPVPGNSGTISFSDTGSTSTTLTWTKAADNVSAQNTLVYKVVRSETNNIDTAVNAESNGTLVQDWTADIDSVQAVGLTAGTTYYFNVLVRDEAGNTDAYTMNSVTPDGGQVSLTITVNEPNDETITFSENDDIAVTQNGTLTITVSETFDSYEWYLDGTLVTGQTTGTFSSACSGMSLGVHHLTFFGTKNSRLYSNTIRFIVTN